MRAASVPRVHVVVWVVQGLSGAPSDPALGVDEMRGCGQMVCDDAEEVCVAAATALSGASLAEQQIPSGVQVPRRNPDGVGLFDDGGVRPCQRLDRVVAESVG